MVWGVTQWKDSHGKELGRHSLEHNVLADAGWWVRISILHRQVCQLWDSGLVRSLGAGLRTDSKEMCDPS